jgi:hypothetical protein
METFGVLTMKQQERDRLVALKKAQKRLITQRAAAEELQVSERQVRRLLVALGERGDGAVIHGLRGRPSNRRIAAKTRQKAKKILGTNVYSDFGPTLASEHLARDHGIRIGREALRQLMIEAGLWKVRRHKKEQVHVWRPRRSRFGELVQWDTSTHDWLEGRGPDMYLIHLIDDASSRMRARFVESDSTLENMALLREWVEQHGRMLAVYTDGNTLFHNLEKTPRDATREERESRPLVPTQIGRALEELGIELIRAYSPEAKGRVERSFQTAQDRLVKELRVAKACTLEQANRVLQEIFLPWWNRRCTVKPAQTDDAHRPLSKQHNLKAIFSLVAHRQVLRDYTFRLAGQIYQIERASIVPGLRNATLRLEQRGEGGLAVAFRGRYLRFAACSQPEPMELPVPKPEVSPPRPPRSPHRWMDGFDLRRGPHIWQARQS